MRHMTPDIAIQFARERHASDIDAASNARQIDRSQRGRPHPIRRTLGRSIIRIGERLASEPSLGLARSLD